MPTYSIDQIIAAAPRLNEAKLLLLEELLNAEQHLYSEEDWRTICYVMKLSKNDLAVKAR